MLKVKVRSEANYGSFPFLAEPVPIILLKLHFFCQGMRFKLPTKLPCTSVLVLSLEAKSPNRGKSPSWNTDDVER